MNIKIETHAGIKVLSLEGELTVETAEELKEELSACPEKAACLILDLSSLGYVDSSGLGLLVQFHKSFRSNGGRLVLVSLTENVRKVVEITRLFKVFEIFPSKEEALRSVKSEG